MMLFTLVGVGYYILFKVFTKRVPLPSSIYLAFNKLNTKLSRLSNIQVFGMTRQD